MFKHQLSNETINLIYGNNLTVRVVSPESNLNDNAEWLTEAADIEELMSNLNLLGCKPQVVTYPGHFHPEMKALLDGYAKLDLDVVGWLTHPLVSRLEVILSVDATNLDGGLSIWIIGDGVNRHEAAEVVYAVGSADDIYGWVHAFDRPGTFVSHYLTPLLTTTDKRLLGVLSKFGQYRKSSKGITSSKEVDNMVIRRNASLAKSKDPLRQYVKTLGDTVTGLYNLRDSLQFPPLAVQANIHSVKEKVKGVAFYLA